MLLHAGLGGTLVASLLRRAAISGEPGTPLKRAVEAPVDTPQLELPSWAPLVALANLAVFLPLLLILTYTLQHIFPTLAMVESETLTEHGPIESGCEGRIAAKDPRSALCVTGRKHAMASVEGTHVRPRPVTSGLRSLARTLRSHGGPQAYLRGFSCLLVQNAVTGMLQALIAGVFPHVLNPLAALTASLALVQLSTAWVHIVITPRSTLHFWQRLPPFRRTFDATCRPTALLWLAVQAANLAPFALAFMFGFKLPVFETSSGKWSTSPADESSSSWKMVIVMVLTIATSLFLVVPAHVVLVRVQASLLPETEDAIVPIDRAIGGVVAPTAVDGKDYCTMSQAWHTFPLSAWRRLIALYLKTFLVNMVAMLAMAVVIVPQIFVVIGYSNTAGVAPSSPPSHHV